MKSTHGVNRRTVLRSLSSGVVGGAVLVGNASARPSRAFGFIQGKWEDEELVGSQLPGKRVELTNKGDKVTVECVYGEKYSTREWEVTIEGEDKPVGEPLALLTDGYKEGDVVEVSDPWHDCFEPYGAEVRVDTV